MKKETRTLAGKLTFRADDKGKKIGGYAAIFNSNADIGGYMIENIAPGAFTKTLKDDIRALIDHDSGRVIGRTSAGSLRLSEDAKGLAVEIDLPDTTDAHDLAVLIERGDISGMSFGFEVTKHRWDDTGDVPVRTVEECKVYEVSVVAFPAYDDTTIAMRALEDIRKEGKQKNFAAANQRLKRKADLDLRARSKAQA